MNSKIKTCLTMLLIVTLSILFIACSKTATLKDSETKQAEQPIQNTSPEPQPAPKPAETTAPKASAQQNNDDKPKADAPASPKPSEAQKQTESSKKMPVYPAPKIQIDGDLSDWKDLVFLKLPEDPSQIAEMNGKYEGPEDIAAEYCLAYDDENLYMAIKVTDNTHFTDVDAFWKGDSIQFAIGDNGKFGPQYGFSTAEGVAPNLDKFKNNETLNHESIKLQTIRKDTLTIYESAIPWKSLLAGKPEKEFNFNILVNDNDGAERKVCLEITDGINKGKTCDAFRTFELLK